MAESINPVKVVPTGSAVPPEVLAKNSLLLMFVKPAAVELIVKPAADGVTVIPEPAIKSSSWMSPAPTSVRPKIFPD